jgi:hypothetical protein
VVPGICFSSKFARLPPVEQDAQRTMQQVKKSECLTVTGAYQILFHPAPTPGQEEVEALVEEVTVVAAETMAEKDPLLAQLLAIATAGAGEACPATRRREIRIVKGPDERPVGKGTLCGQSRGFNL